jgi:glycosyltransferase involved in cell wall biosynthesis
MAAELKISVVTPCFNSAQTIRETIKSVLKQNYPRFEHIVMDGGSTDGTLDILRTYPHLLVESGKDEGHYHAMNKGIARATGDVVAILNADDYYLPGTLQRVGDALARHPEWDGVFGDVVFVDGQGREMYHRQEACFDYDTLRYAFGYIAHPALFIKKSTYERIGAYRHKLFKNLCDYDLVLRMAQADCRIGLIPEFLVCFRYHEFGQSLDKRIIQNFDREMFQLKREHGCPGGWLGRVFYAYGHARRQWQKLRHRRTCDLIPARWILRRYVKETTTFSSNLGLEQV